MTSYFTNEFFAGNRAALRRRTQAGVPIVVAANGLLQRGADSAYPFSQDASFWYLTGIEEPDVTLVIDGDDEFLIVPVREANRETFDGAIDIEAMKHRSGIDKVVDEAAGWKHLDALLTKHKRVATPAAAPHYIQAHGLYANPARARLLERIQQHVEEPSVIDIRTDLAQLRMIKQPAELKALQAAIEITADTLNESLTATALKAYTHEYEIEAEISRGFRRRGASGHSFEPIVASGKRACTLHNVTNNAELMSGDLLVCDVGAEVEHYAADITRTVSLGPATARQKAVYQAVAEVQEFALGLLKPGTTLRDYEDKVARRMGAQLKQLKLIKAATKDTVRQFFPHATTHFLGLNVHDVGDYTKPLSAGVVLTCEPGLYIKAEGIGVRIEDDVLITETGNKVLSKRCRKGLK
jgi:Xaa-Pro aminopeptidase